MITRRRFIQVANAAVVALWLETTEPASADEEPCGDCTCYYDDDTGDLIGYWCPPEPPPEPEPEPAPEPPPDPFANPDPGDGTDGGATWTPGIGSGNLGNHATGGPVWGGSLVFSANSDGISSDTSRGFFSFSDGNSPSAFGVFDNNGGTAALGSNATSGAPRSFAQSTSGAGQPETGSLLGGAGNLISFDAFLRVARVIGAVSEFGSGIGLAAAASWTGVGAVAGGLVALHGLDELQVSVRELTAGRQVDSLTSEYVLQGGFHVSPPTANRIDAGISILGSLGAGVSTVGLKLAAIRANDPLAEGLSAWRTLSGTEKGSQALWNSQYEALGGTETTPLAKAQQLDGFGVNIIKGVELFVRGTGLTPGGNFAVGVAGAVGNVPPVRPWADGIP